jgi:hypothetical protein
MKDVLIYGTHRSSMVEKERERECFTVVKILPPLNVDVVKKNIAKNLRVRKRDLNIKSWVLKRFSHF